MLALGIGRAADKLSVATVANQQVGVALGALAILDDFRLLFLAALAEIARVAAVRIACAGDEAAVAPKLDDEILAALRALLVGWLLGDFRTIDIDACVLDAILEGLPEFFEQRDPLLLASRDGIEFVLEPRREIVVDVLGEIVCQELVDDTANIRRDEPFLVHRDVFAILQGRDDGCIGRGSADAVFLERLDEACLVVAWRWLGEVLFGTDREEIDLFAFPEGWQQLFVPAPPGGVILALEIDAHETGFRDGRAAGAKNALVTGCEIGRDGVDCGVCHLACDGAFPDELVELALLVAQGMGDLLRDVANRCRANRLVRFLGVFRLGLEASGLLRMHLLAPCFADVVANFVDRLVRERHRVCPHVGDQADSTLADVHTLVELLGDTHGPLRREAEFARCLLLQGRGDERRRRIALALFLLDLLHGQFAGGSLAQGFFCGSGAFLVGNRELGNFFSLELREFRREGLVLLPEICLDRPVFARLESLDLLLALDDHAQGRALHAPGRQASPDFFPQKRREVETDEVIECPAGLLGIDEIH